MNANRDLFYILGLQPGASPAEIKAEYRRLARLYHPDHDQSLDAEVKYNEIRIAYEALRDCHPTGRMSAGPTAGSETSKQASWASQNWTSGHTAWTSKDWATEYDISYRRIPFEWKRLPFIFISSLKEMNIHSFYKGILAFCFACMSCFSRSVDLPYSNLGALFYVNSWIFYIFFRYYFAPSAWSFFMKAVVGIVYGTILVCLIVCFYTVPKFDLIVTGFFAVVSVWVLMHDFG